MSGGQSNGRGESTGVRDDRFSNESGERISQVEARAAILAEENRRLRTAHRRTRKREYRRTGLGLAVLGLLAGIGAILFPRSRDILLAISGTGLFAGLLVFYFRPERYVAPSVGRAIHDAFAQSVAGLVTDFGLTELRVYVPTEADGVRLFLPQCPDYVLPDDEMLSQTIVAPSDERQCGLALTPAGDGLYDEFERKFPAERTNAPGELAVKLADALVVTHELVDDVRFELDANAGKLAMTVENSAYGPIKYYDHPVVSFVATGLARGLRTPVEAETVDSTDDHVDPQTIYSWNPNAVRPDSNESHNGG